VIQSVPAFARASVSADDLRRDDEAWNLPRPSVETAGQAAAREELDWDGFVHAYFPGSRRHDLDVIVAYATYRRTGAVDDQRPAVR